MACVSLLRTELLSAPWAGKEVSAGLSWCPGAACSLCWHHQSVGLLLPCVHRMELWRWQWPGGRVLAGPVLRWPQWPVLWVLPQTKSALWLCPGLRRENRLPLSGRSAGVSCSGVLCGGADGLGEVYALPASEVSNSPGPDTASPSSRLLPSPPGCGEAEGAQQGLKEVLRPGATPEAPSLHSFPGNGFSALACQRGEQARPEGPAAGPR